MYLVEELQNIVNNEIEKRSTLLKEKNPIELYRPIEYTLDMGGKRLRPVLLLLGYSFFSDNIINALPAALAIEVFHNFTLLHDDIMDKAEVRRNRPTVHVKFSENSAILSGDAMAFISYQYLLECKSDNLIDVIKLFSTTAIEVCEGQQFDMDFENRLDVTETEYIEMIRLKTAVLLACALKAGALLANQNNNIANSFYEFGLNLGLAFQLQDDLLDSFGNQKTFGKKIGGDILANKKTYLLIKALESSSPIQKVQLENWINKREFNPEEKISAVKEIYHQIGIRELTLSKIDLYFNKSSEILRQIPVSDVAKQQLLVVGKKMLKRDH